MALAAAGAACAVFLLLGLLVYRAVAASTAVQFDELLQQLIKLARGADRDRAIDQQSQDYEDRAGRGRHGDRHAPAQ